MKLITIVICLCCRLCCMAASPVAAGVCRPTVIELPAAQADTFGFAYRCRGLAQTFRTTDSLLAGVTVWSLPTPHVDLQPRTLFVLGTFASGTPNQFDIIGGPYPLVVADTSSTMPIAYHYAFDPPLMLHGPGRYTIVIQASDFNSYGILAVRTDVYADGMLCVTGPIFECVQPGGARCDTYPGWDMCFGVEMCNDSPVSVRRRAWGQLKLLYR